MNQDDIYYYIFLPVVAVGVIFYAIKFHGIPEYNKYIEKELNQKKQKQEEFNSKQYVSAKAHLKKHINMKVLLLSEELQYEFLHHIENQIESDLPFDKTTWTTTNDIDSVLEHYLRKGSSFGGENTISEFDILNRKKDRKKENLQEMRKRRKSENE